MTGRRPALAAAAVAAVALVLGGCSGFPQQGPIVEGRRVDAPGYGLQSFASPPHDGASPEAIVDGFLQAGEEMQEDHKVARLYLASPQTAWQPDDDVVVLEQTPQIALVSSSVARPEPATGAATPSARPRPGDVAFVRVTGRTVARVDGRGLMALPSPDGSSTFDVTYHLRVGDNGQWRIDELPASAPGLVLTDEQFRSGYRAVSLYFADATGRWLVPDLRWFPDLDAVDPTPTAMLVVSALLQGPAPWLGPGGEVAAVTSGAVPQAELTAVGGIRVDGGVVHVDLDNKIRSASPEQRRLLQAQLTATLRDYAGASSVVLTAGQAALDVPAGGGPAIWSRPVPAGPVQLGRTDGSAQIRPDQQVGASDPRPLCLTARSRAGELDTSHGTPTCRERKDLAGLGSGVSLPTEDAGGRVVAAVVQGGNAVVAVPTYGSPPAPARQVLAGPGLTAPSIDGHGWVWSATHDGRVLAGRLGQRQREVDAPWLRGVSVKGVRISPEGARALLLVNTGGTTQAWITGIARGGADGTPLALSSRRPLRVVGDLTRALDAGWSDIGDVVVLGSRGADAHLYVLQGQVGGERGQPLVSKQVPDKATGLAISGPVDVYVRTSDGKAAASVVGDWTPLDVRDLTLPN